ncbi:hypothetical protein [Bacillus massiliglaciei]|uniref:hypothetical protein n=1 Tax=Bacillus massiliglaciei TaxID=1816693 RepID=UPI000DA5FA85|nr:hypothetical protein [Bacillus massiliglaciei]
MNENQSLEHLILSQTEKIAASQQLDFLYENEYNEVLGQIVQRDEGGSIAETLLMFRLEINETKGTGEIIYYQSSGEFKRQKFDVEDAQTILAVLTFIKEYIAV